MLVILYHVSSSSDQVKLFWQLVLPFLGNIQQVISTLPPLFMIPLLVHGSLIPVQCQWIYINLILHISDFSFNLLSVPKMCHSGFEQPENNCFWWDDWRNVSLVNRCCCCFFLPFKLQAFPILLVYHNKPCGILG